MLVDIKTYDMGQGFKQVQDWGTKLGTLHEVRFAENLWKYLISGTDQEFFSAITPASLAEVNVGIMGTAYGATLTTELCLSKTLLTRLPGNHMYFFYTANPAQQAASSTTTQDAGADLLDLAKQLT